MSRTAVLAGATGLVGSQCLRRLTSEPAYLKVVALVRRPSGMGGSKVVERSVNFAALDPEAVDTSADVFCALGTTIRKAGSQEAFRKVDYSYVVSLAKVSLERGARQFVVISSVGADPASSNFYLKTKGEMEQAISPMAFHAVHICRPSLLLGNRLDSRPGERIGIALAKTFGFAFRGPLRKYHAIKAETVAAAMVAAVREARAGVHVYEYDDMQRLAHSR